MPEYFFVEQDAAAAATATDPMADPADQQPAVDAPPAEDVEVEGEPTEEEDEVATETTEGFVNAGTGFSVMEFVKRLLKYLVEGLVVAIAAYTIPAKKLNLQEVGVIALSAAATFALLDLFAPTISYAARQGAGFGMGANLVGFPKFG